MNPLGLNVLTNRVRDGVQEKRCPTCVKWFPATPEYFHRKGRYLHSWCKTCNCEYMRPLMREKYWERKAAESEAA